MGLARAMKVLIAVFALCVALAAASDGDVEENDNLSLHAEHFPHSQGSKSAIYQFQIDNNNPNSRPTKTVQFTAEISPDMDVENAYYFNEKSQSKPGTPAAKGTCRTGQRSPQSQESIRKKYPGARITFPKLVRCDIPSVNDFVTLYVHAKAGKNVKAIPADDMIKVANSWTSGTSTEQEACAPFAVAVGCIVLAQRP